MKLLKEWKALQNVAKRNYRKNHNALKYSWIAEACAPPNQNQLNQRLANVSYQGPSRSISGVAAREVSPVRPSGGKAARDGVHRPGPGCGPVGLHVWTLKFPFHVTFMCCQIVFFF